MSRKKTVIKDIDLEKLRTDFTEFIENNGRGAVNAAARYTGTSRQNLYAFRTGQPIGKRFVERLREFLDRSESVAIPRSSNGLTVTIEVPRQDIFCDLLKETTDPIVMAQIVQYMKDTDRIVMEALKINRETTAIHEAIRSKKK